MTHNERLQAVAETFTTALLALEQNVLARVSSDDVVWTIPGSNRMSGIHRGPGGLIMASTTSKRRSIAVTVERYLSGRDRVLVLLHEVGDGNGRSLDVRSALALSIQGDVVTSVVGYVSDIDSYDRYLA
jgi:ketosteroid isomerase-like protein